MNRNAFVWTMEAVIAFLFVAAVVSLSQHRSFSDNRSLEAVQLQHDLLVVWASTKPDLGEMAEDAKTVFPNQTVRIELNNQSIVVGPNIGTPWVSSDGSYFDDALQEQIVKLTLLH